MFVGFLWWDLGFVVMEEVSDDLGFIPSGADIFCGDWLLWLAGMTDLRADMCILKSVGITHFPRWNSYTNKLIEPHAQEDEEIAIYTATDLESF